MKFHSIKTLFALCFALFAVVIQPVFAKNGFLTNVNDKGVILDGYDSVAFVTQKKAVPGDQQYQAAHDSARYYFSSKANLEKFIGNPEKYAPQYGGFCAVAMSMGRLEPVDVRLYQVVDGKLYFQRNAKAAGMWKKMGAKTVIARADENWLKAHEKYGSHISADQLNDNLELSLEAAKTIVASGRQYAKEHRAPGAAIAIVDAGGHLLYLERLDGTFPAAAMVAFQKARTAAMFRFSSKILEDAIINGRGSLVTVGHNMLRGGIPIYYRGKVIGGIGVSGAASADQDVEIAKAGADTKF